MLIPTVVFKSPDAGGRNDGFTEGSCSYYHGCPILRNELLPLNQTVMQLAIEEAHQKGHFTSARSRVRI